MVQVTVMGLKMGAAVREMGWATVKQVKVKGWPGAALAVMVMGWVLLVQGMVTEAQQAMG
jgi:hypothetical protein